MPPASLHVRATLIFRCESVIVTNSKWFIKSIARCEDQVSALERLKPRLRPYRRWR